MIVLRTGIIVTNRWQDATNDRLVNNIIVIVLSCDTTQLQQTI